VVLQEFHEVLAHHPSGAKHANRRLFVHP